MAGRFFARGRAKTTQSSNEETITATLDLHGFTKSEGIAALTRFFEQVKTTNRNTLDSDGDIWVQIITGSGAHSGGSGGPVLRDAVQSLLVKRNMIFKLNRGKGSFNVKANSGHELFKAPLPTDSKVIVQEAPERVPALPKKDYSSASLGEASYNALDPLPSEVSANDSNLRESQREGERLERERRVEEKMVNDAVARSLEVENNVDLEESLLLQAMSLSMQELHYFEDGEGLKCEAELQEALTASQKEYTDREDEINLEVQEAMQMSQRESTLEDEQWMEILEASKKEFEKQLEEEEEVLQESLERAIALSLKTKL